MFCSIPYVNEYCNTYEFHHLYIWDDWEIWSSVTSNEQSSHGTLNIKKKLFLKCNLELVYQSHTETRFNEGFTIEMYIKMWGTTWNMKNIYTEVFHLFQEKKWSAEERTNYIIYWTICQISYRIVQHFCVQNGMKLNSSSNQERYLKRKKGLPQGDKS